MKKTHVKVYFGSVQLKEITSFLVFHFHKVGGHSCRSKLKQQRPRNLDFYSLLWVKLQKHWILHFP